MPQYPRYGLRLIAKFLVHGWCRRNVHMNVKTEQKAPGQGNTNDASCRSLGWSRFNSRAGAPRLVSDGEGPRASQDRTVVSHSVVSTNFVVVFLRETRLWDPFCAVHGGSPVNSAADFVFGCSFKVLNIPRKACHTAEFRLFGILCRTQLLAPLGESRRAQLYDAKTVKHPRIFGGSSSRKKRPSSTLRHLGSVVFPIPSGVADVFGRLAELPVEKKKPCILGKYFLGFKMGVACVRMPSENVPSKKKRE